MTDKKLVLGTPIYGMDPSVFPWWPAGQQELYEKNWNRLSTFPRVLGRKMAEYASLSSTLHEFGVDFSILRICERRLYPRLVKLIDEIASPDRWLPVPALEKSGSHALYPRDLAVVLPNETILVNTAANLGPLPDKIGKYRLKRSPLGEGGRIHIRKHVAVVPTFMSFHSGEGCETYPYHKDLQEAGLTVIQVPNNLMYVNRGDDPGYIWDDHLDRSMGLLEAKDGSLHLFIDYRYVPVVSGKKIVRVTPAFREKHFKQIREQCEKAGVIMHIMPRPLRVPLSLGFMQLEDGRTIVTGGEGQLSELLNKLLGRKRVYHVGGPFRMIPTYNRAGIHCLLNEFPVEFLEYLQNTPPPPD
ncbi:MAG TPA: hypothetical protein VLA04_05125 [Verrucomicrobiae bacterium]|nr:hypothetical protein [Verrucomicrobiae bacterium]